MAEFSDYSRITPRTGGAGGGLPFQQPDSTKRTMSATTSSAACAIWTGTGVLAGLTEISEIISSRVVDGKKGAPARAYCTTAATRWKSSPAASSATQRFGFEETAYLLMFGQLPTAEQLKAFNEQLAFYRSLPTNFVRDVILKPQQRHDEHPGPVRADHGQLRRQAGRHQPAQRGAPVHRPHCHLPLISVYAYQAYNHYKNGNSLYIHTPRPDLSTAENILTLLRPDGRYTTLEAHILDLCLVLHAEHGGGNNSTFTTHVVTSSGTDTVQLHGRRAGQPEGPPPRRRQHQGGADVRGPEGQREGLGRRDEIRAYLLGCLEGQRFDKSGLIYGMGHAGVFHQRPPRHPACGALWSSSRKKSTCTRNTPSIPPWSALRPRSSAKSAKSTRAFPPRRLLQRLRLPHAGPAHRTVLPHLCHRPAWRAGAPTAWRSSSTWARSSVRPTWRCRPHREYVPMDQRG